MLTKLARLTCLKLNYTTRHNPINSKETENHILQFAGNVRCFLENNNKTQTISLVRKRFKLFWFLAIRVKRARFLQLLSCSLKKNVGRKRVQRTRFLCIEIESNGLGFSAQKTSPKDSFSKHRKDSVSSLKKRVHWTQFLCIKHCQFPSFCLITPIPQQHQLPTAATSRGHNSPPTATSRGSQLD